MTQPSGGTGPKEYRLRLRGWKEPLVVHADKMRRPSDGSDDGADFYRGGELVAEVRVAIDAWTIDE